MTYIVMADGERWLDLRYCEASRWNLSEAVKLANKLIDLGYENVYLICPR